MELRHILLALALIACGSPGPETTVGGGGGHDPVVTGGGEPSDFTFKLDDTCVRACSCLDLVDNCIERCLIQIDGCNPAAVDYIASCCEREDPYYCAAAISCIQLD